MRLFLPALLLAATATITPAHAGTPTAADISARQQATDRLMADYQGQVPGAALLVLHDGQPLYVRGYGLASLEDNTPVDAQTNFRLASVSKQFTAMAIVLLAADGRLQLDDPLARWLPGLPPATRDITLRHLLVHASGLIDYEDVMPDGLQGQLRDADVLEILKGQDRTYFTPGSSYRYSNSAYALLALVVEKASGMAYPQFLHERIFSPLGMNASVARTDEGPAVAQRAWGYSHIDGQWQRTDQSPTSAVLGDGGIYSSISDLARWDAALYDQRLLPAQWLQQVFTPGNTVHGETDVSHYGLGVRLQGEMVWHSGESIGFRNVQIRWPQRKLSVIVLSNRNAPEPYALARRIAVIWGAPAP